MLGHGAVYSEFLYMFVGLFASGGVVLNGSLYPGVTGNAGAVGSMPVPGRNGSVGRLLDRASIIRLERDIAAAGEDPLKLYQTRGDWSLIENEALIENWIKDAANSLAYAVAAACCVIDFPTVVIDGSFQEQTCIALCEAVRRELQEQNISGIQVPDIVQGRVGSGARSVGAACLPLYERYLLDQTNLLKGQS
jgi:predicted NBD/HSP70 family sugar kinase